MFAHNIRSPFLPIMIAFVGSVPLALPAGAAEAETHSVTVRYTDLDLKTDAGAAALHARIAQAARAACGPIDSRSLAEAERVNACRTGALAAATPAAEMAVASARIAGTYAMAGDTAITVAGH